MVPDNHQYLFVSFIREAKKGMDEKWVVCVRGEWEWGVLGRWTFVSAPEMRFLLWLAIFKIIGLFVLFASESPSFQQELDYQVMNL